MRKTLNGDQYEGCCVVRWLLTVNRPVMCFVWQSSWSRQETETATVHHINKLSQLYSNSFHSNSSPLATHRLIISCYLLTSCAPESYKLTITTASWAVHYQMAHSRNISFHRRDADTSLKANKPTNQQTNQNRPKFPFSVQITGIQCHSNLFITNNNNNTTL